MAGRENLRTLDEEHIPELDDADEDPDALEAILVEDDDDASG